MTSMKTTLRGHVMGAGGAAVLLEVSLRKLCERYPESQRFAYADLEREVLPAVIAQFADHLTDEDKHLLKWAVRLRNKIVHGQFQSLSDILEREFGMAVFRPVQSMELPDDSQGVRDALTSLVAGEGQDVHDQHQKKEAGTYAWELEVILSGGLVKAMEVFGRGIDLMDRLVRIEQS
ncbi:MAG: hypothetical protein AAF500_20365 [Myxococcota bacterium]